MMLVSGDGKLAKALVKLSSDDMQIAKLPKKVMDITNVAKICHKYGIKFIYISTDFVYDSKDKVDEDSGLEHTK